MKQQPSILYLTDLYIGANGRNYYEEDLYVTSQLRNEFDLLLCHPTHSKQFEGTTDIIVSRNTGPVMNYQQYFREFVTRINSNNICCYNAMTGKADTQGKDYLPELTRNHYPVIPTIDKHADLHLLPATDKYVVKLKNGADSIGMQITDAAALATVNLDGYIAQPYIDFQYEVSFYYIDRQFQYAMYAPDKTKRWELEVYTASEDDLAFANLFVEWNNLPHGIQRVDACRIAEGGLLLVELEDLNPFLSLDRLNANMKEQFVTRFSQSIHNTIQAHKR